MNEELHNAPETDPWHTGFEVSSVSRLDLVQAGFPQELVAQLTDEHMARIAAKMGDYYTEQSYWDHLTIATEHVGGISPAADAEMEE